MFPSLDANNDFAVVVETRMFYEKLDSISVSILVLSCFDS